MQKYYVAVDDMGNIAWYKDAKMTISHRVGGPAIECADGCKSWYQNDQRHRTDGPAIEWNDGHRAWYLNGEKLTQEEHAHRVNPAQEMTVAEIEKLLGKRIKIIK